MIREKEILSKVEIEKEQLLKRQDEVVANAIQAQASGFHSSQKKEIEEETARLKQLFEDEYNLQLAVVKHQQIQKLKEIHEKINDVKASVDIYGRVADDIRNLQLQSKDLHAQSAALLVLDNQLQTSKPLGTVISSMKSLCKSNPLIGASLDSLSHDSIKNGIPTTPELKNRFKVVRKEVRKASLIPEFAPNFLGHAIGSALAKISWTPTVDAKLDTNNPDIEDRLASIGYHLDMNELDQALNECKAIEGYPRLLMQDWESSLKQRYAAEQVLSVLKSELALKHKQFSNSVQ